MTALRTPGLEAPTTQQAALDEARRLRAARGCRCGFCGPCFERLAPKAYDPESDPTWWRNRLKGSW